MPKRANAENFTHGHSLEAVPLLRSKVLGKDPFFIFRLNDQLMNDKPTFVFERSCTQVDLLLSMNCNGSNFLNGEYCFIDGTFKRCPGFVTLCPLSCMWGY